MESTLRGLGAMWMRCQHQAREARRKRDLSKTPKVKAAFEAQAQAALAEAAKWATKAMELL